MRFLSTPQAAIKLVLLSQVVLGTAIVALDLRHGTGNAAPNLFAPSTQGPSIRPYRPDLRPAGTGAPAMRPMPEKLEFASDADIIRITGQIAPGDADRFVAWLDSTRPQSSRVLLDSSGGSVSDALAMGHTIRAAGYATEVGQGAVCLSACPYLLAAGTTREVADTAVVGVHQHYFGKNTLLPAFMAVSDVQRAQASVMDYLTEMGIDLRLMAYALRTPPEDIRVLDRSEMRELALITDEDSG
ncbi:hypothetical protein [Paracoccus aestuariivivens]|uniref:Uncharacterized protein n=1 Tax=Paracoccus aestuariivivens TaxID=1820333 RepID=A0A6L6J8X1_9RHOB|nr:hypothetical protein [Paracoccus aestuariivivens]MTH77946.1 hypothetical protein [Paracoccus aestuariivivens]